MRFGRGSSAPVLTELLLGMVDAPWSVVPVPGSRRNPDDSHGFARRARTPRDRGYVACAMAASTDPIPDRALADLRALRELTEDDRGAQRVAWTDTWAAARAWLRERLAELPVTVDVDEAGNLWAVLDGASERHGVLGSHIDSVPDGGWLDGALGVLGGLEVLRTLAADRRRRRVTVALVDWADEEGARFGRSLLGSSLADRHARPARRPRRHRPRRRRARRRARRARGRPRRRAARARAARRTPSPTSSCTSSRARCSSATGCRSASSPAPPGSSATRVRIRGQAVQGGGFPMDARRDALVAGARLVLAVREAARDERSRATVGAIDVRPAIPTAVPGLLRARRSTSATPTPRSSPRCVNEVHDAAAQIAVEERVEIDFERIWSIAPVAFDADARRPRRRDGAPRSPAAARGCSAARCTTRRRSRAPASRP